MATDSTSDMTNDSNTDSNLRDIADVPAIDVLGRDRPGPRDRG